MGEKGFWLKVGSQQGIRTQIQWGRGNVGGTDDKLSHIGKLIKYIKNGSQMYPVKEGSYHMAPTKIRMNPVVM